MEPSDGATHNPSTLVMTPTHFTKSIGVWIPVAASITAAVDGNPIRLRSEIHNTPLLQYYESTPDTISFTARLTLRVTADESPDRVAYASMRSIKSSRTCSR